MFLFAGHGIHSMPCCKTGFMRLTFVEAKYLETRGLSMHASLPAQKDSLSAKALKPDIPLSSSWVLLFL